MLLSFGTTFCSSLAEDVLLDLHQMHLFPGVLVPFHCRMSLLHFSCLCSWPCHIGFDMCCSMSICILMISISWMVHIPLQLMVRIFSSSSLYLKWIVILSNQWTGISIIACSFLWSGCFASLNINPQWYLRKPEMTFIFVQFYAFSRHICITCLRGMLCCLPSASYPTIWASYIQNVFERPLNISFNLLWNMPPAGATARDSVVSLYLLN